MSALQIPAAGHREEVFDNFSAGGLVSVATATAAVEDIWPQLRNRRLVILAFRSVDTSASQSLDRLGFRTLLETVCFFDRKWGDFERINARKEGRLSLESFKLACQRIGHPLREPQAWQEFSRLDQDFTGFINMEEFIVWTARFAGSSSFPAAAATANAASSTSIRRGRTQGRTGDESGSDSSDERFLLQRGLLRRSPRSPSSSSWSPSGDRSPHTIRTRSPIHRTRSASDSGGSDSEDQKELLGYHSADDVHRTRHRTRRHRQPSRNYNSSLVDELILAMPSVHAESWPANPTERSCCCLNFVSGLVWDETGEFHQWELEHMIGQLTQPSDGDLSSIDTQYDGPEPLTRRQAGVLLQQVRQMAYMQREGALGLRRARWLDIGGFTSGTCASIFAFMALSSWQPLDSTSNEAGDDTGSIDLVYVVLALCASLLATAAHATEKCCAARAEGAFSLATVQLMKRELRLFIAGGSDYRSWRGSFSKLIERLNSMQNDSLWSGVSVDSVHSRAQLSAILSATPARWSLRSVSREVQHSAERARVTLGGVPSKSNSITGSII